jgi:hypothetical protein
MAIPIGSSIFYVFSLLLVCFLVLLLLRYFLPLRTTPAYLLVPVFLAIALPANLILLVPIDLASNPVDLDDDPNGIWLPERAVLVAWRLTYWLTFGLTWIILPLLGEYVDSGEREWKHKMIYSLKSNAKYQLIVIAAAIVGAIYFFLSEGFNPTSLKALVMALAYAWGLLLAIYLMGHGLVAVPRKLLVDANYGRKLRKLQSEAPKAHEKLIEATDQLQVYEDQVQELQKFKTASSRIEAHKHWILELAIDCDKTSNAAVLPTTSTVIPEVITTGYLAELSRKLQRSRHKKLRYASEWHNLLARAVQCQTILDAKPSGKLTFAGSRNNMLTPSVRYQLYAYVLPGLSYFGGGLLALASLSIIWSELTKTILQRVSVISISVAPSSDLTIHFFPSQVFAAFWISYMSACALYSITVLPIWGNRALVYRTTYSESAAWYAAQVAKLTVPLAYNFLTFLPKDLQQATMFYQFLGESIVLTPLGRGFSSFFPILLVLPALAALFGWYGRIKQVLGFEDWLAEDEREDMWREGKSLIERHGKQLSGQLTDSPGSRTTSLDISRQSRPSNVRQSERRPLMDTPEEAETDPGFFSDFSHRVKNTFDSMETPSWVPWGKRNERSAPGEDTGTDWNRLLAGGPGHVRLG